MAPGAHEIEDLLARVLDPADALPGEKGGGLPAGVLVPVIKEGDGSVSLLVTRRTMRVKDHKGQMSFPGGVVEEGDSSYLDTALRETREEVGLDPGAVRVMGRLKPYDTITGYRIHPFVGVLEGRPEVEPSEEEIEAVFFVGLEKLMDAATFQETRIEWDGKVFSVKAYDWGGPVIWGATAAILSELIERLK